MNKLGLLLSTFALLTSVSVKADFEYKGNLQVTFPTKVKEEKEFALAYKTSGFDHEFQIAQQSFKVSGQPESYSIAMVLEPNNLVRVMEFSRHQIETFNLDLGEYKLNLKKKVLNNPVKGDYILSIQNVDYFFQQNLAQITFKFNEDGIKEIEVDGMVASLGLNQEKGEDCSKHEEGSDAQKECEFNK